MTREAGRLSPHGCRGCVRFFVATYGVRYDMVAAGPAKDHDVFLAFRGIPAGHWKHIRTANPIENTRAIARHRTGKTKGCLRPKAGLARAFTLMMLVQEWWRKHDNANRMPEIMEGIEFKDGVKQLQNAA